MNLVNLVTMGEGDSSTSTTTGDALPWSAAGPVVLTLVLCFFRTLAILPSFFPSLFSFRYPICSSHFLRGSRMPLWNIYDFLGKSIGIIFHTLILSSCLRRERERAVRRWFFFRCCYYYLCFAFRCARWLVGLSEIYDGGKLSLLLMNFHENFFFTRCRKMRNTLSEDYFLLGEPTLVNNTFFFSNWVLLPWRGKLRGESTISREFELSIHAAWRSPIWFSSGC